MCETLAELFAKAATDEKYRARIRKMEARRATCEHRTTETVDVCSAGWALGEFCTDCLFELPVKARNSNYILDALAHQLNRPAMFRGVPVTTDRPNVSTT